MSEALTREAILNTEVDVKSVTMKDLAAFIAKNELGIEIKPGKTKATILNAICDALEGAGGDGEETPEPKEKPIEKAGGSPAKKQPAFLERRKAQIEAEKKAIASAGSETTGIDPATYVGEDVPEFLKRRMQKGEG